MSDQLKTCSKCGEVKAVEMFRQHRTKCRKCESLNSCQWAKSNPRSVKRIKKKNSKKYQKKARERNKLCTKNLEDRYVRNAIHTLSGLPHETITDKLIEVKRKHLQILRKIKEMTGERQSKNP